MAADGTFDEYDHDYETFLLCAECKESHENCECEDFKPEEHPEIDECQECGLPKSDATHGDN